MPQTQITERQQYWRDYVLPLHLMTVRLSSALPQTSSKTKGSVR